MDPVQILEQVNAFYSTAFSQLLTTTLIILGFGSVVLPLVLQYLQIRSFRMERESLKSQIIYEIEKELDTEIKSQFKSEMDNFQKQIDNEFIKLKTQQEENTLATKGSILLIQGIFLLDKGGFIDAGGSFARAAIFLLKGKDEQHCQRCLNSLVQDCLPKLNKKDFENNPNLDSTIDELLSVLGNMNENQRYQNIIDTINVVRRNAKSM
jgi:hypothetical protein